MAPSNPNEQAFDFIREHLPGPAVKTDERLLDSARNVAQTIYHPTSTCKMVLGPFGGG